RRVPISAGGSYPCSLDQSAYTPLGSENCGAAVCAGSGVGVGAAGEQPANTASADARSKSLFFMPSPRSGHIAHLGDEILPLLALEPVPEYARGAAGGFAVRDDGISRHKEGILPGRDALVRRSDAVDGDDLQPLGHAHVVCVVVNAVAYRAGRP